MLIVDMNNYLDIDEKIHDASLDEIRCKDVIDCCEIEQVENVVNHILRKVKRGGTAEFVFIDIGALCRLYYHGELSAVDLNSVLRHEERKPCVDMKYMRGIIDNKPNFKLLIVETVGTASLVKVKRIS